jgi:isoquinoline 1-oxidoreductase beta subunit
MHEGVDESSVEGAAAPYAIANLRVEAQHPDVGVPVLWWRSVGHTHTAYATEVFLDELAAAAGRDPVEMRRELLQDHPRHLAVLNLAAEKAGWGSPLPAGRARGIAVHESFGSFVAEVAEVTVDADGSFKVDRVVCAVDCGIAVNPDIVRAQMEGGIGYGLSAALREAVTMVEGRVEQSNFTDYQPLRISEMPVIEVHIVPSAEPPSGVGEPGLPPLAPAVANAIRGVTGKPLHRLPFGARVPV